MALFRIFLGAVFLAAAAGIVLSVLLASNHRETTLVFLGALKRRWNGQTCWVGLRPHLRRIFR